MNQRHSPRNVQRGKRSLPPGVGQVEMEWDEKPEPTPALRGLEAVCRCNNVKHRSIERAIAKGACSIRQVAEKTSATLGHCGGSCTPEVQQMIDDHLATLRAEMLSETPEGEESAEGDWWVRPARKGTG